MNAALAKGAGLLGLTVLSAGAVSVFTREPVPALPAPVGVIAPNPDSLSLMYARAEAHIDAAQRSLVTSAQAEQPPSSGAGVANSAEAWLAVRRGSRPSLPRYLLENRRLNLTAADLLRHRALNPRDVVLDGDRSGELDRTMAPVLREIDAAMTIYHEVVALEVDALVASGRKRPLEYKDDGPTRAFLSRNPPTAGVHHFKRELYVDGDQIDMFRCSGGTLFGFSEAEAPRIRGLADYLAFLRADLAAKIAQWFESVGAMTSVEAALFMEQVYAYRRPG